MMMVRWREAGEGMGTVDLRALDGEQVVIHFGGAIRSVDAYTFGNSLIAFADTVRAVNSVLDPNTPIEVRLEALGDGSFRAIVKRVKKGLGGFFSRGGEQLFWAAVAFVLFDKAFGTDPVVINIAADQVEIIRGNDRIIVPRSVYDQREQLTQNTEVQKNVTRTFEVVENDDAVTNFGLTHHLNDPEPLVQFPRADFPRLSSPPPNMALDDESKRRERRETAVLVILKLWLTRGNRKWSFEWNGIPVSAPIHDRTFWDRIERRELLIGSGDALEVELQFDQLHDEAAGVWVNDQNSFDVVRVIKHIPRSDRSMGLF